MAERSITINGKRHQLDVEDEMPLLWVLRDTLGLTGTKYGCGVGLCGACTILDGDQAIRSCLTTIAEAAGRSYMTIEGLSEDGAHPIQRAWLEQDVAQCGYCQPGMMLEIRALLRQNGNPGSDQIDDALGDHVCRCGSYPRIQKAALLAARLGGGK